MNNAPQPTTLFLEQGETLGGSERFLIDFFQNLSASEIQKLNPLILGAEHPKYREMLPDAVQVEDFEWPSVRGGVVKKIIICAKLLIAAWKLVRIIKKKNVKSVFSNTPRTHFVMLLARTFFFAKTKWVAIIHDFTVPDRILKWMGRKSDVMVANVARTASYIKDRMRKADHEKITIIHNGLDFRSIPEPKIPTEIKNVLLIGRIDPRKGQLYALEAAHLLQERNPDLEFIIVGSSFEGDPRTLEYEKIVQQFFKEHALTNVTFIPEVDDPFAEILKCDLLLALSTVPETFGRITTEALSMGKLVLAFDQHGPGDIVKLYGEYLKQDVSPLLVEQNNPMSLAEAIGHFADHPNEAEIFTEKARDFVEHYFDLRITKERMLEVLS